MSADPLVELRGLLDDDVLKRFGLPDGDRKLTRSQWKRIERALHRWSEKLVAAGRAQPARSYRRGMHQVMQFLHLLHEGEPAPFLPRAERSQVEWLNRQAETELAGAMGRWADEIRSSLLFGLRQEVNPTQTASWLYRATRDAGEDWRRIARTETARANALGRYVGAERAGYERVWVPPHAGECADCRRLLANKVFSIEQLRAASNFKRKKDLWVPCLPLHPNCRHTPLPFVEDVHGEAQQEYERMRGLGLDDETLDEMFDSSGQLRPQYESDARLAELFAGKTFTDPFAFLLGGVVRKRAKMALTVAKGFFDAPHRGLDPLLWDGERLRDDARDAILSFWTTVLGDGWEAWATVYITGSATGLQWETGYAHPWLGPRETPVAPDVDTHLVIDYEKLREQRPLWAGTPVEVRGMLEAWVDRAKRDVEIMPGVRLDAFIRLETTSEDFRADIAQTGQGVYDVNTDVWLISPQPAEAGEHYGSTPLAGLGGKLAEDHPDWLATAEDSGRELDRLLSAYEDDRTAANLDAIRVLLDQLYQARSEGFLGGKGQASAGNFTWQWLERYGRLVEAKNAVRVGASSDRRRAAVGP